MVDKKLADYVKTAQGQLAKEQVYINLINRGWLVDDINTAYQELFLVSPEQKVSAPADIAVTEKSDAREKMVHVIVTVGIVLIGAGIFSFIAANWQEMGRGVKIGSIFISMLASHVAGWYIGERLGYTKTGYSLIILGTIIYGAGIFLIAQMFNVTSNWPDGFILWMLGALAMAFVMRLNLLHYLTILLGIVALVGHPLGIFEGIGRYNPFITSSSLLLVVATVAVLWMAWINHRLTKEIVRNKF